MNKKKESKVVPNVRFKGFTDDWKQRKLTEIVNRVNKSSNSDVLPKVEFEDIVSGEGRLNKDISSKFDSRKGTLFEPENILYGKLRPYLKNWLFSDFVGVALGDFWVFEATDVSVPSFDYYLIQSDDYQKVANDTSGTKMPRSDWKNVSSTDFAIPSKDEQKQIGAFFKQLDDTITIRQQKITLLIKLKKAMLEKMFPKKGSVIPEIRFKGFANAWEQRKLSDVADSVDTGKSKFDKEGSSGEYPILGSTSVIGYDDEYDYEGDFILTARVGANAGSLYRHAGKVKISDNTVFIQASQNIEFLYHLLIRFDIKRLSFGTGQPLVKASELKRLELMMPTDMEEQMRIGVYFKNLDHLITLHQRKIDKLKNLKKAMLDQMLI